MRSSPFTNQQLYDFIRQNPGGIQNFLMQFSIIELEQTIKRKRDLEDQRVRNNRSANLYKTNVLDLTLKQVILRCKAEGLIDYFNWKLESQNSRIQNHSKFGRMLANNIPQKYYIGQKSNHFNHARQIQESYDIYNYNQENQSEQQGQNQQNNHDNEQNQPQPEKSEYNSDQDLDGFVVDDDEVQQSYDSEEEFKQKKAKGKKTKNIKKNQKESKIVSKKQKGNQKIMKVQSDDDKKDEQEQENLGSYMIKNTFQNSSPEKMQSPQTMQNIQVNIKRKSNKKFTMDSDEQ